MIKNTTVWLNIGTKLKSDSATLDEIDNKNVPLLFINIVKLGY